MHKDKSEKSASSPVEFPENNWSIFLRDDSVYIGRLNLMKLTNPTERYVGAMQFDDNPWFGMIANKPFPADITHYDPVTGDIKFKILGAATLYNPDTSAPYRFVFEGRYESDGLHGTAKVPKDFGKIPSTVGEDGDNVTWISSGPTGPPHKSSR